MRNNSTSDPYSYDGTNVLKNKLNITDERELLDYERAIVSKKLLSFISVIFKLFFNFWLEK